MKKQKAKVTLEFIAEMIAGTNARMEKGFAAISEDLAEIRTELDTKADAAEMHQGFETINRRLDTVIQVQLSDHAMRIKSLEESARK